MAAPGRACELIAGYWTLAGDIYPGCGSEVSPRPIERRMAAAAAAGFTGIGLLDCDLKASVERFGFDGIRRLLRDNGLSHVELEVVTQWFETGEARAKSDTVRRFLVAAASELGARHVKFIPDIWGKPWPADLLVSEMRRLARDFQPTGARLAFEFMPFSNVKTPSAALDIIAAADEPNLGLCIDAWHSFRSGTPHAALASIDPRRIVCVELNDGRHQQIGDHFNDNLHHREYPGDGEFGVVDFMANLMHAGFEGPFSLEIIAIANRERGLAESATLAAQSAERCYIEARHLLR